MAVILIKCVLIPAIPCGMLIAVAVLARRKERDDS